MIFAGGPIRTMASPATVEAVRVDGRRITAVGSLEDLRSLGEADVFDLDGRCLMPGFVDAHTHPLMHGQCMSWADLSTATSMDEVVKLLREHAWGLAAGAAIRGFGYDQHRLCEDRHPTAVELDRVARDRPVVIMHTSGHGYVANSYALAEATITAETRLTSAGHVLGHDARVTRGEAFAGYTSGGALALRRADVGALSPGKLADLVILDHDPMEVETDRLPDVTVDETWVDGRRAWPAIEGTVARRGRAG